MPRCDQGAEEVDEHGVPESEGSSNFLTWWATQHFILPLGVLGIQSRAAQMLSMCSTTYVPSPHSTLYIHIWNWGTRLSFDLLVKTPNPSIYKRETPPCFIEQCHSTGTVFVGRRGVSLFRTGPLAPFLDQAVYSHRGLPRPQQPSSSLCFFTWLQWCVHSQSAGWWFTFNFKQDL